VVVVEFEGADAGGIGLEGEYEDFAHESHVFGDILGDTVCRSGSIGFFEGGFPALEFTALSGAADALFDFANGVEVFVEFLLIAATDGAAEGAGIFEDSIKDAAIGAGGFVAEESIEGEGGEDFQRGWRGRGAPGDMAAVEHGVVFVDGWVGFFAAEHEAGDFDLTCVMLSDELVDAGAGADSATGFERCSAEEISGL